MLFRSDHQSSRRYNCSRGLASARLPQAQKLPHSFPQQDLGLPLPHNRSCRLSAPRNKGLSCRVQARSEEHTSELQSLMRISYAVFCLKKKIKILLSSCITQFNTHTSSLSSM